MHITALSDHPEYATTVGEWHWAEWGHADPDGSQASWIEGISKRNKQNAIPTTFLAIEGEQLLGSVSLVDNDMETRPALQPWLAGLFVHPDYRNQGVGQKLTRHATDFAFSIGVPALFLYTSTASALYEKLGWVEMDQAFYEGEYVVIMKRDAPQTRCLHLPLISKN